MEDKISLFIAFFSGVLSFFSPCVLPLIPLYIGFITGLSLDDLIREEKSILGEIILFCLGFSFVFVSLGVSAVSFGNFIVKNQNVIKIIGGVIILLFGFHILGIFKIKFLDYEKRIHIVNKPLNIFGPFIVGMAFAVGWTPCIGPILGSILTLAATKKTLTQGIVLLGIYSIGLSLPFIFAGLLTNRFLSLFSKLKKYLKIVSIIIGVLLLVIGILLLIGGLKK